MSCVPQVLLLFETVGMDFCFTTMAASFHSTTFIDSVTP